MARLRFEMGLDCGLREAFSFVYRADLDSGLTEHEFDHVLLGIYTGNITPNPSEVADFCFKPMDEIRESLQLHANKYSFTSLITCVISS